MKNITRHIRPREDVSSDVIWKESAGSLKAASIRDIRKDYTLPFLQLQVLFIFILSLCSLSPPRFSKIDRNYN